MKLVVAALLLAASVVAAKVVIEYVAPEETAAAATSGPAGSKARARAVVGPVQPGLRDDAVVASLRITGPGVRAAFLSDVVSTHVGTRLTAVDLEADRARIVERLVARGHLDAAAGAPVIRPDADGHAYVELPVEAGPAYTVRAVEVTGRALRKQPALRDVPTLRPGEEAVADRIEASAELLRRWLAQRKVRAGVTVEVTRDAFTKQVDVRYVVD